MDWFLYDNNLRHERVNLSKMISVDLLILITDNCFRFRKELSYLRLSEVFLCYW